MFFTVCFLRGFLTQPQRFTAAQTAEWICAKFPHLNREVQEPLVIFPKSPVRIKQVKLNRFSFSIFGEAAVTHCT